MTGTSVIEKVEAQSRKSSAVLFRVQSNGDRLSYTRKASPIHETDKGPPETANELACIETFVQED